jgi:hypothetical protein
MKEKNHPKLLFFILFVTVIICLGLLAVIVAMSLSLNQWKQENKLLKDKTYTLQYQVDNLKPFYSAKQQAIAQAGGGNPDIGKLIKDKPVLGGNWGCWSEKSIKFLTDDKLIIQYDDGHMMGAMIVQVKDVLNIKTWKVLWNTLL